MKINQGFLELQDSYLFSTISRKVADFQKEHPEADIIRLGIGDVTLPICKVAIDAMRDAAAEQGTREGFHGYGPEQGYGFLKEALQRYYSKYGVTLALDEIFVSDGAKSDVGNILDLFDRDNTVLITDPVYPVYVDTNIMDGRQIKYLDANQSNDFLPLPYEGLQADIIYICSPCNPTGAVYSKEQLKQWVDFANSQKAVILFDAAYETFVSSDDLPHSIFEVEGAKTCAIEFCSFSKTAGFTGTRCGYTVVPMNLKCGDVSFNKLWLRRQTTKFNGVSYIVQRGAAAVLSDEGMEEAHQNISYYMNNAKTISDTMDRLGIYYIGGKHSPYIWMKCPQEYTSWEFFDKLLAEANVVTTPGSGFGKNGEGFIRITAFGDKDRTIEAMARFEKLYR